MKFPPKGTPFIVAVFMMLFDSEKDKKIREQVQKRIQADMQKRTVGKEIQNLPKDRTLH